MRRECQVDSTLVHHAQQKIGVGREAHEANRESRMDIILQLFNDALKICFILAVLILQRIGTMECRRKKCGAECCFGYSHVIALAGLVAKDDVICRSP